MTLFDVYSYSVKSKVEIISKPLFQKMLLGYQWNSSIHINLSTTKMKENSAWLPHSMCRMSNIKMKIGHNEFAIESRYIEVERQSFRLIRHSTTPRLSVSSNMLNTVWAMCYLDILNSVLFRYETLWVCI